MLLQLAFVLIAIIIGARIGGIGLGVLGGLGLGILTFGFGLQPTSPPIEPESKGEYTESETS